MNHTDHSKIGFTAMEKKALSRRKKKSDWYWLILGVLIGIIIGLLLLPDAPKVEAQAPTNQDYCQNLGNYRLGENWKEIISYCENA